MSSSVNVRTSPHRRRLWANSLDADDTFLATRLQRPARCRHCAESILNGMMVKKTATGMIHAQCDALPVKVTRLSRDQVEALQEAARERRRHGTV